VSVNDPNVDETPVSVSGLSVDRIPVSMNDPDVDGNQIDWTLSHNDFPHYQISFLDYLNPFSGAHPLLPSPSLSLVCVTAQVSHLSRQIAHTLKHPTLSDGFGTTPLQGRTILPLVHDPYLGTSCDIVLARWIPKKIPPNNFQRNSLNVFQTFSRA